MTIEDEGLYHSFLISTEHLVRWLGISPPAVLETKQDADTLVLFNTLPWIYLSFCCIVYNWAILFNKEKNILFS